MPTVVYSYTTYITRYITRLPNRKLLNPNLFLVRCGYGVKPAPFFLSFIRCTLNRIERNNS